MRTITLFLCAALAVTSIDAASYQKTDGTIVDPILEVVNPSEGLSGGDLPYSGNNLEPHAGLNNANLVGASLNQADLTYANLTGAILVNAVLYQANLTHADLYSTTLTNATVSFADLTSANLTAADLTLANLISANLTGANLTEATLHNANLINATMTGATLTDADFTGASQGTSRSSQLALTPLDETIIGGAQLHEANFSGADLSGAIFDHENDAYDATGWETATWTAASFHYLNQPLFPTGMIYTDHGIVVRTPEPAALLLALFGLALLPRRRRR